MTIDQQEVTSEVEELTEQLNELKDQVVEHVPNTIDELHDALAAIPGMDRDAAAKIQELIVRMVGETIESIFNDRDTVQDIFTTMLRLQVNSNVKLRNIESQISNVEYVVVSEEHPASDVRVTYEGAEAHEWVFHRRVKGEWIPLELTEVARTNLEAIVGKYYNNVVGSVGYVLDANALED